jgi:ADP-heptose:LPS heptosyltransferase
MSEETSRKLDFWVGIPLCWLLTLWRRISERRPRTAQPPRSILFVKLSEMGALIVGAPAFDAAARRVGRQNVYCLAMTQNRQIFEVIDGIPSENVLRIRDDHLGVFVLDVLRMMRRCRREGIDAVVDIESFSRISALLSYLTGARIRVGWHRYTMEGLWRGDLFTHPVPYNVYQHASVQFLALVEALDASPDERPLPKWHVALDELRLPAFYPKPDEVLEAEALLERVCRGRTGRPRVILNPNLTDEVPVRRWPREHYLELGRRVLASHPEAIVLLTGLERERALSEQLAAEISSERAFSLAGETTLRGLVVLLGISDLLVTSDCGPAHMAAITPVPIVSIFGPETPRVYAPLSPRNLSLDAELACSPCLSALNLQRSPCRDNVCMRQVTVEQAFAASLQQCPTLASPSTPSQTRA